MDIEAIKLLGVMLKDSGLFPVLLFALMLKVYVINGSVNKHFDALKRERRLLRRVILRLDGIIKNQAAIKTTENKEDEGDK